MATDDHEARGNEMGDGEIDTALREIGYGTLALARDGEAYGVPVSFGYDGERVFLNLIRFGEESEKIDFAERTDRACLTATDVESRYDWRSVVVTGPLEEVADGEAEYVRGVMDDNAWHPSLYATARASPMTGVRRTELRMENVTGRQSGVES